MKGISLTAQEIKAKRSPPLKGLCPIASDVFRIQQFYAFFCSGSEINDIEFPFALRSPVKERQTDSRSEGAEAMRWSWKRRKVTQTRKRIANERLEHIETEMFRH
jgi:hypothetical protein